MTIIESGSAKVPVMYPQKPRYMDRLALRPGQMGLSNACISRMRHRCALWNCSRVLKHCDESQFSEAYAQTLGAGCLDHKRLLVVSCAAQTQVEHLRLRTRRKSCFDLDKYGGTCFFERAEWLQSRAEIRPQKEEGPLFGVPYSDARAYVKPRERAGPGCGCI